MSAGSLIKILPGTEQEKNNMDGFGIYFYYSPDISYKPPKLREGGTDEERMKCIFMACGLTGRRKMAEKESLQKYKSKTTTVSITNWLVLQNVYEEENVSEVESWRRCLCCTKIIIIKDDTCKLGFNQIKKRIKLYRNDKNMYTFESAPAKMDNHSSNQNNEIFSNGRRTINSALRVQFPVLSTHGVSGLSTTIVNGFSANGLNGCSMINNIQPNTSTNASLGITALDYGLSRSTTTSDINNNQSVDLHIIQDALTFLMAHKDLMDMFRQLCQPQ